jgi:hypothetical protein
MLKLSHRPFFSTCWQFVLYALTFAPFYLERGHPTSSLTFAGSQGQLKISEYKAKPKMCGRDTCKKPTSHVIVIAHHVFASLNWLGQIFVTPSLACILYNTVA